jgi:SAM-dependent methyltransferase
LRYLNLACGDHFIVSEIWENCDFAPQSKLVRQVDLLKKLPYENSTFDVVYCSHFIEHIHLDQVLEFISECKRVLKPNGLIRLVLPDFENIAREYINNIDSSNFEFAEFNVVEMIDQCVRSESGGSLSQWYTKANKDPKLNSYINSRTGHESKHSGLAGSSILDRLKRVTFYKLKYKIELKLIYLLVSLLPKWFRHNHIIKTATGERHLWVHDFKSISKFLHLSGFRDIQKINAHKSTEPDFPIYPLDINSEGLSRKGSESMYIEARNN